MVKNQADKINKVITIKMDERLKMELEACAKILGVNKSKLIRDAIRTLIKDRMNNDMKYYEATESLPAQPHTHN